MNINLIICIFFIDTIKYEIKLNNMSLIINYIIIWILHLVKRKKI